MKKTILITLLILFVLIVSCSDNQTTQTQDTKQSSAKDKTTEMSIVKEDTTVKIDDEKLKNKPDTRSFQPIPSQTYQLNIEGFAFSPGTITIAKGDTVVWTNSDNAPHTVTGNGFDSGTLSNEQKFSHTFDQAGTYEYKCNIHSSMKGKVIVK